MVAAPCCKALERVVPERRKRFLCPVRGTMAVGQVNALVLRWRNAASTAKAR